VPHRAVPLFATLFVMTVAADAAIEIRDDEAAW